MLQKQAMPRRPARQKVIDFTVERRVREFENSARRLGTLAIAELSQADRQAMIKDGRSFEILKTIAFAEVVLRQMIDELIDGKTSKQEVLDHVGSWKRVAEEPINRQFVRDFLICGLENTREYLRERKPDQEIDRALREAIAEFRKVVNLPARR